MEKVMEKCQFFDGETAQDIVEIQEFLAEEWTRVHQNDPLPTPSDENYDELSAAYERYDDAMFVANNT
jgi:hypothetical protein